MAEERRMLCIFVFIMILIFWPHYYYYYFCAYRKERGQDHLLHKVSVLRMKIDLFHALMGAFIMGFIRVTKW